MPGAFLYSCKSPCASVIIAQALHSCEKSAIIALTNSAVKYVDFVHTFIFVLFALFVIIFAHFYLLFLFPVSTIDSRPKGEDQT